MLTAAFVSAAALLVASIPSVDAHGYMLVPLTQFKGTKTSAWVVQIDPVWKSDKWDGNKPGSVTTFDSLKKANNFVDLKTLMDDTSVYGADCGFSNPNGTPQPVPTDGKATFSRAMQHVGPCEIWLDDKKAFSQDNCMNMETFDVDYSPCNSGGCKMMRFYWLAFQGLNGKTVWQSYKDCIPLKGSGGGGTSQTSPSTSSGGGTSQTSPSSGNSATQAPSSGQTPSADTPQVTPAPSSKCKGHRRRRY